MAGIFDVLGIKEFEVALAGSKGLTGDFIIKPLPLVEDGPGGGPLLFYHERPEFREELEKTFTMLGCTLKEKEATSKALKKLGY